jgi:ribose 5-phosphate isomerase A
MEERLNNLPGVVTNGVFSYQGADVILMGTPNGVVTIV